jgi:holo-[acyl-carrier protein] synthase
MSDPTGVDIVGVGIDATDIPRIRQTYQKYGERFLRRVFTADEIAYCLRRRDPVPHLAGRFAAKEAGMKAIGTGHSRGVLWRDVEVVRAPGRPPQLHFHGSAARHAETLGVRRSLLTITHSDALAFAQVLLLSA